MWFFTISVTPFYTAVRGTPPSNRRCGYLLCLISLRDFRSSQWIFRVQPSTPIYVCTVRYPTIGVVIIYSVWSHWGISFLVGEFLECNLGLRVLTVLFYKRGTGRLFSCGPCVLMKFNKKEQTSCLVGTFALTQRWSNSTCRPGEKTGVGCQKFWLNDKT